MQRVNGRIYWHYVYYLPAALNIPGNKKSRPHTTNKNKLKLRGEKNNKTTKARAEIIESIIEYFRENESLFNDCMEELDSYNGYLGDDRYYPMEELDDLYREVDPSELLRRAFYGYDEDSWTTDSSGNKEYGAFNPNRDYFTFNGYGNLVSADYKDYSSYLDHYAVESMEENRRDIYSIENDTELSELFDTLEELEQE